MSLRLRLAFQRVRDELVAQPKSARAFVANMYELQLIEADYPGWIADLGQRIADGDYLPGPIEYCFAPKGDGLVRPGARLSVADRVVYTAAVGGCLKYILDATAWSQRSTDFSPRLNPQGLTSTHWLLSPYKGWDDWRKQSLRRLDLQKTNYVLTADIAGYFENVSISMLVSDLGRIGCPQDEIQIIHKALRQWSPTADRGIPQGVLASDVLAKIYLEAFDSHLKADGLSHMRYADDIRVFCRSEREARAALVTITRLLRDRGLTLQSAKTKIRPAAGLRAEFEGAVPAIEGLRRDYIDELIAAGLMESDPSMPMSVIDGLVEADPDGIDPEVLRRAFRKFVLNAERPNKTMRAYILRRLAPLDQDIAVEHCSQLLVTNPEATPEVLRYFQGLGKPHRFEKALLVVLRSRELSMYPYQRYLVLDWLWRNSSSLRTSTLKAIRKIGADGESPQYLRASAIALVGRFGDHADQERVAALFGKSSDPFERAQLLCSLPHLEKGRRNSLLGRVKDEKPWVDRAVRHVRLG